MPASLPDQSPKHMGPPHYISPAMTPPHHVHQPPPHQLSHWKPAPRAIIKNWVMLIVKRLILSALIHHSHLNLTLQKSRVSDFHSHTELYIKVPPLHLVPGEKYDCSIIGILSPLRFILRRKDEEFYKLTRLGVSLMPCILWECCLFVGVLLFLKSPPLPNYTEAI